MMSTLTFLAWSLLSAAVFAACLFLIRRIAVAKGAPPLVLSGVQRVNMLFLSLFVSAAWAKVVCDTIDLQLPAWTRLIPGAMIFAVGATFRTNNLSYGNEYQTRLLSTMVMVIGTLILALEILWR